jgi:hypothetical protein
MPVQKGRGAHDPFRIAYVVVPENEFQKMGLVLIQAVICGNTAEGKSVKAPGADLGRAAFNPRGADSVADKMDNYRDEDDGPDYDKEDHSLYRIVILEIFYAVLKEKQARSIGYSRHTFLHSPLFITFIAPEKQDDFRTLKPLNVPSKPNRTV